MHLSKGQLVDIEGRLQTRQWDDDAGKRSRKPQRHVSSSIGRMRANGCTLISRSCTTGWLDWAHGELWVCDDGLLRKSLGLVETVLHLRGGYGVRQGSVHRLITPDEIAAISAGPRNRWTRWDSIAKAELRGGIVTDSLHVELRDCRRLKFLWAKVEGASGYLEDVLPRLLGPRYAG